MQIASANPSTAQTNAALISNPYSDRPVKIKSIWVSSDTALTVSLVDGDSHSVIWRMYVGATGGFYGEGLDLFQSLVGEGVDLTTSTDGNVYIKVGYE